MGGKRSTMSYGTNESKKDTLRKFTDVEQCLKNQISGLEEGVRSGKVSATEAAKALGKLSGTIKDVRLQRERTMRATKQPHARAVTAAVDKKQRQQRPFAPLTLKFPPFPTIEQMLKDPNWERAWELELEKMSNFESACDD